MRLKDKVIIVTGSTMGIGKAIARRCMEEGARVVLNGLEKEAGEQTLREAEFENALLLIEDLTADGAPRRLVQLATECFGKLDAIVNNAAAVVSSNIEYTDLDLFRDRVEVNTLGAYALVHEGLTHLYRQRDCGRNIWSVK